jgi:adhesin transport system outer membrane protein
MKLKQVVQIITLTLWIQPYVHAATLQEAVEVAVKTNPDVLAASNERNAVSKQIDQAKAGYLPTVDLAVGTGYESTDSPVTRTATSHTNVHKNRDEASINLRQMLFDGLETKNEVRRQMARTDSRAYSVFGAAENTGLDAVQAYLNVLRRQKLVELAATNLEAHERTHDQISLRSERGVGRKSDMDQSLGRVALAKANLMAEESNLRDQETSYSRIIGEEAENLSTPEILPFMLPETLEEAIAQAIDNHPILKSANADLESAKAQHDTALAPFYPRVDFELGATANNDLDGVDGHSNDVTAMFRLRYNLLNGGKDSARREETAYLINQAAEVRNNTQRQVEESVKFSWNALQTVRRQMEYFKLHVESSKNSRDAYRQQFSFGQRTLLDLLDSENELFVARQALVNAQYDELYASYRVLNSMGELLQSLNVQLPEATQEVSDKR